ncbi:MAG: hypothetical protein L3J05_03145, partial [Robiginitomaculum sp.]|nr:hypothetical protein [Robiginitomaculum sp.]
AMMYGNTGNNNGVNTGEQCIAIVKGFGVVPFGGGSHPLMIRVKNTDKIMAWVGGAFTSVVITKDTSADHSDF